MSDDEGEVNTGGEAEVVNEAAVARDSRRAQVLAETQEMMKEYIELRRIEKEKEEAEINEMRERISRRKAEREEEHRRQLEQREAEKEHFKKVDEERKKAAEEAKIREKEERIRRKKEEEEKKKMRGKRSFKVTKKQVEGAKKKDATGIASIIYGAEDMQKSKEELEEEKWAVLEARIQPLEIDGLSEEQLREKAREMHDNLYKVESDKYDNKQRFDRQSYDLMELAERARQMQTGGGKRGGLERQDDFDREHDKHSQAPPPVRLASKFERNQDQRSMEDRLNAFGGTPEEGEEDNEEPDE